VERNRLLKNPDNPYTSNADSIPCALFRCSSRSCGECPDAVSRLRLRRRTSVRLGALRARASPRASWTTRVSTVHGSRLPRSCAARVRHLTRFSRRHAIRLSWGLGERSACSRALELCRAEPPAFPTLAVTWFRCGQRRPLRDRLAQSSDTASPAAAGTGIGRPPSRWWERATPGL